MGGTGAAAGKVRVRHSCEDGRDGSSGREAGRKFFSCGPQAHHQILQWEAGTGAHPRVPFKRVHKSVHTSSTTEHNRTQQKTTENNRKVYRAQRLRCRFRVGHGSRQAE
eukprot:231378-Chlamydomonas_euryale.AAC.1